MPPMTPVAFITYQILSLFFTGFLVSLGWHTAKKLMDKVK